MSYWEVNTALTISASRKCTMKYRDESNFETKKEYVSDNLSLSLPFVLHVTQKQFLLFKIRVRLLLQKQYLFLSNLKH